MFVEQETFAPMFDSFGVVCLRKFWFSTNLWTLRVQQT